MTTQATNTTTEQVAKRLVELCRADKYDQAQTELFSTNATSTEPETSQMPVKRVEGLEAIKQKGKDFGSMVKEMHKNEVSDALVTDNHIALTIFMDVTMNDGSRMPMKEIAVYEVKDGKIISEEFFY